MPMDGITLGFVARELHQTLRGGRVDRIQQPQRDALIITIRNLGANHRLLLSASAHHGRVHITRQNAAGPMEPPMFCMLLRKHLAGAYVTGVGQVGGDRILRVDFEIIDEFGDKGVRRIVAEIMGRHSNIMLLDGADRILDAIRHVGPDMSRVREIQPGLPYLPPPAQDKLDPALAGEEALRRLLQGEGKLAKALAGGLSGFSGQAAQELAFRLTGDGDAYLEGMDSAALAGRLRRALEEMPGWQPPVALLGEDGVVQDIYPFPQLRLDARAQAPLESLSQGMDLCYGDRDERERMKQRTQSLRKTLRNHVERCEKKRAIQMEALQSGARQEAWRVQGELILANLYRIKKGMESVELENYNLPDAPLMRIALDVSLTPAQNAQAYFKRYQKLRAAQEMAAEQLKNAERELLFLENQLEDLDKCTEEAELEEIRQQLAEGGYVRATHSRRGKRKLPASRPYHYCSQEGIPILVGKNSAQNDRITGEAEGEETWLHAKDMPGSHVIIKHKGPPPEGTLRQALQLAAWYSKGRQSANVPVDYTLRKYVKKPGGAPLGFVVYTNHRTLFVTPEESRIKQIQLQNG